MCGYFVAVVGIKLMRIEFSNAVHVYLRSIRISLVGMERVGVVPGKRRFLWSINNFVLKLSLMVSSTSMAI